MIAIRATIMIEIRGQIMIAIRGADERGNQGMMMIAIRVR